MELVNFLFDWSSSGFLSAEKMLFLDLKSRLSQVEKITTSKLTTMTTTTTTMTTMVNFELVTFGLRLVFTHCLASGRELNNRIDQVLKFY